jgi:hypothetical protein
MAKLDPFREHPSEALKARGPKVLTELLDVVQQRADSDEETFADAAAKLPEAWHATMLLSHVVRRLEAGSLIPEALADLPEVDDRTLVITALKEIGEKALASTFLQAENVLDEEESAWGKYGPPETAELSRVKKKLFVLVGSMPEPFPAAR